MTHLSDFSYLQRCALEAYMALFLLYRVWANDRFKCLHPKRIFAGELRSIITVLYIMMLVMQTSWDVVSTWIKYTEKFIVVPGTDHIISKPYDNWTNQHKEVAQAMDYVECVNLSMQTGVFFLLQCFWNYLSNAVAKRTFMSSWEFKFYIFWALGSIAIFPILQWYFREDPTKREAIPQLAYSIEVLITSALGVRSHRRFKRILNISRNLKHGAAKIVEKLAYFKDMNIYLTIILFFYGISLCILCIDGITSTKTINSNKFASDLLIAFCNVSSVLMWIVGISIFHPRHGNSELGSSLGSRSMTTTHNQEGDIEINHSESKTNGGSAQHHVSNHSNALINESSTVHESNGRKDLMNNNNNGHFLRPMSPVEVDYHHPSVIHDRSFSPSTAHHFNNENKSTAMFSSHNMTTVDDPYTNHPINFAMVEPSKRYNDNNNNNNSQQRDSYDDLYRSNSSPVKQHDYPMQNLYGTTAAYDNQQDDFKFDPSSAVRGDHSFDYLQTPNRAKTNNNGFF
ncbi:uncharacterized protein BX663DRAFT_517191 [Cokeromyces recurvatus]|uniref:uncharacterized protein n=1 Tax=Cokeromyces recurvatus TaxID=90255 RepID=UPI00222125CF|nr:uncharacterized protein BX663DRAFT_517191 [Cokeromyces recurvatus]KAI7900668.1 hypothetical protein BX663DRAFT_517191 [Cokeromyces recurvatus]